MTPCSGQYLLSPADDTLADIYWALLLPETEETPGILSAYLQWKPWIAQIEPYVSPPDPPHVTLFYDTLQTEWYQDLFQDQLQDHTGRIDSKNIYVAPEGVAAGVELTTDQQTWYMLSDEAVPHISLALHPQHQAKELGGMVKRSLAQTDWQTTNLPHIQFSPSTKTYKIIVDAVNTATFAHDQVTRQHGREKTDHHLAQHILNSLPAHLWADGPTDVGLTSCPPVSFTTNTDTPIWIHQYPHRPQAEEGISDTIQGLLESGVLEPSYSFWNTPILPVEKKGTGKYRMAHDLRAINDILVTKTIPVPNPYVALANLDPSHSWFTCIDLANAFFCLPLAPDCRDIFSFTFRGQQLRYTRLPQGFALSPGLFNQVLKQALSDCQLPDNTTLVQYVDDLLIAAPTSDACLTATQSVLQHIADKGFKVSKSKLQIARKQVSFLGRVISQKGVSMSPAHRSAILHHAKPDKVKDMLSFLGLTGYSRN